MKSKNYSVETRRYFRSEKLKRENRARLAVISAYFVAVVVSLILAVAR